MKAIKVSIDADPDVQRDGRSAVMRRAVEAYLRARRERRIADAYREGYGDSRGIDPEFEGWDDQGRWPED